MKNFKVQLERRHTPQTTTPILLRNMISYMTDFFSARETGKDYTLVMMVKLREGGSHTGRSAHCTDEGAGSHQHQVRSQGTSNSLLRI